jgi:hypothetical protein
MTNETSWAGMLDTLMRGGAPGAGGATYPAGSDSSAGGGSVGASRSLAEAIDRLCSVLPAKAGGELRGIEYQRIANGPVERVLGFNNNEVIKLEGPRNAPYFSSQGILTDLQHCDLPGSKVLTTFPVDPAQFPQTVAWPNTQVEPFNQPPRDNTNTTGHGYSKQAYFFEDGKDLLVTVGPSLPKIAKTKNGGAQFWVGSIGVVSQGKGKYEGARGMSVYIGSAYLPAWPDDFNDQVTVLRAGFNALVGTYFKLVLKSSRGS